MRSDEPGAIASALGDWCDEHLGRRIIEAHRFEASVGLVADVELEDGERVVVKAVQPGAPAERLAASVAVRTALGRDHPCPAPIGGPFPRGTGAATVDAWLEPGTPATRRPLADGFAALVRRTGGLRADVPPLFAPDRTWVDHTGI